MNKVLYISYDGMTDPLGQSQVIPYLQKLSEQGFQIHILSAEKQENFEERKDYIANLLQKSNIKWHYISYTKKPPVVSTIKDIRAMKKLAKKLHKINNFKIAHCRSYISAFAGMYLKNKFGVKFLFDMRGFYADERIDGNLWNIKNPVYNAVYRYFKKKEKQFLNHADYTISLTYKAKDIIHEFKNFDALPIEVIPCCADTSHFDFNKISSKEQNDLRKFLNLKDDDFVICYLGSLGTWYMPDEMMQFFSLLLKKKPEAKFLFITRDNADLVFQLADKYDVPTDAVRVKPAHREDLPTLISLCKASLFFIKPVFSKAASSPTKLAELLGMGIPVICNSGVGDIDKFVPENKLGILIDEINEVGFSKAIEQIDDLEKLSKKHLRQQVENLFSLELGAKRYADVYNKLIEN
ncbi:MAG: glycosyltransferase family 4 protein [Bacteroidales bacterium]|nr:glycosyltransferase family 4 protein [Bacteroidales bacterium]